MNSKLDSSIKKAIDSYSQRLSNTNISVTIYDAEHKQRHTVVDNAKNSNDKYLIILHEYCEELMSPNFETYFCNNANELEEIMAYICNNPDIFTHPISEDVMDCCEIVSLESLAELED